MKVVFLDVDGVLNSHDYLCSLQERGREETPWIDIDTERVSILNRICARTGAKVVVSSSWRMLFRDKIDMFLKRRGLEPEIIGHTPISYSYRPRGHEIQIWLDSWKGEPVESFVILDDNSDMDHLTHRLYQTSIDYGLCYDDEDRIVEMFGLQRGDEES